MRAFFLVAALALSDGLSLSSSSRTRSLRRAPRLYAASASVDAAPTSSTSSSAGCQALLQSLFGGGAVDADAVAAACSDRVEWDDLTAKAPAVGRGAVRALIAAKFSADSRLAIERMADGGATSGGFTWHREVEDNTKKGQSKIGLRGTLFAELDADGKLVCVPSVCARRSDSRHVLFSLVERI
jgi:hypothetical protein